MSKNHQEKLMEHIYGFLAWKFRVIAPKGAQTVWLEHEGETAFDAIQDWHFQHWPGSYSIRPKRRDEELYLRFELEDGEKVVSRIFRSGLYRKGGVEIDEAGDPYRQVARTLGVEPDFFSKPIDWIGAEPPERMR